MVYVTSIYTKLRLSFYCRPARYHTLNVFINSIEKLICMDALREMQGEI